MKTRIILISICLLARVSNAQQSTFTPYTALSCQGSMPEDFKHSLNERLEETKANSNGLSKKEKENQLQFSELSNYSLNNILWGGKILYGDTLTNYVNHVADKALANEPALRKELRLYVLKNSDLNAYSTDHGAIFVSMGLLARIRSESQLAFIICHEAVHYKNHHNYKTFLKKQEFSSSREAVAKDRQVFNMMQYSKSFELEADAEGLDIFLKSPYSTEDVNSLFDVLLYAYLPFENKVFDTTYFDKPGYKMLQNYFLSKVQDLKPEEAIADSMHSHPNIKTRRSKIQSLLEKSNKEDGQRFVLSEESFAFIQRVARYELAIIHLTDVELEEAIYSAYLIEKIYGKSMFSDQVIASALYALALQKNHEQYNDKRISRVKSTFLSDDINNAYWNAVEGESQAVYYFIFKIPKKDLNILAVEKLYDLYQMYKDPFFSDRYKQLMQELLFKEEVKEPGFFKDYLVDKNGKVVEDSIHVKEDKKESNKAGYIVRYRGSRYDAANYGYRYYNYAFSGRLDDTFYRNSVERINTALADKISNEANPKYQKYIYAASKYHERHGANLGLEGILILRPRYSSTLHTSYSKGRYTYRSVVRNPAVPPKKEIEIEDELVSQLQTAAAKNNLNAQVIGMHEQATMTTEDFNRYQAYTLFLYEKVGLGNMPAYTFSSTLMSDYIAAQPYLGFTMISNKHKSMDYIFLVYDLKTGALLMDKEIFYKSKKATGAALLPIFTKTMAEIKNKSEGIQRLKQRYGIQ